jgi:hypothetical protein
VELVEPTVAAAVGEVGKLVIDRAGSVVLVGNDGEGGCKELMEEEEEREDGESRAAGREARDVRDVRAAVVKRAIATGEELSRAALVFGVLAIASSEAIAASCCCKGL